jgi:propionyl-CoA synthetase
MSDRYSELYRQSVDDPKSFWLDAAQAIDWETKPTIAWDGTQWFPGATLNTCYNAVDRHVSAGHGHRAALIYDSPVTGQKRRFSFSELQGEVVRVAGMLAGQGVTKGDRIVLYMPMVPETVFAMLACARIGAIHSVVFGGFAAAELAKRIDDAEPKLILAASCGIEPNRTVHYKPLLDHALELAKHQVQGCIILQRPQEPAALMPGRDHDWAALLEQAEPADCVIVAATDPLYILYTSGTTGAPKGVVRDHGGHAVALAWSMAHVYGAAPGEVFWAASDVGWVVGHSYIVYGPLLHGCTTILYEGKPVGTPDAGAFWRVIREHDIDLFFTAPTAIRAIRREDPEGQYVAQGTGKLRAMFLAGERADPDTLKWASKLLNVPVVDHWWQTELGWPALATCLGLGRSETVFGSAGHPVPGFRFAVLDGEHQPLGADEIGELAIELPLPPGCLPTLWRNEEGYRSSYLSRHPGYYTAGDAGFIDENGRAHVMSRIDDIINVAGHRLSTAGIEQIVTTHPAVAECAVIGAADSLKGMVPVALIVPKVNAGLSDQALAEEVVKLVREELGPVAAFHAAAIVDKLPKTRSGKILRATIRDIADGREPRVPATIEDPSALETVRDALGTIGFPQVTAELVRA